MREPVRRWAFWILVFAVPATALLSLVLIVNATSAAGISISNGGSRPGVVGLVGDDLLEAGLDFTAMLPGDITERCFMISALGEPEGRSELRIYGTSSGPLANYMNLSIRRGIVGTTCASPGPLIDVFDGPLVDFGIDFATGSSGHRANASGIALPYLVRVSFDEQAPNSAQGTAAELGVLWEVRSGDEPH